METPMDKLVRLTREDDYEKRWIVVGKFGAIDFHCTHDGTDLARRLGRVGGVEFHYRAPEDYMGPDYGCTHDHCWVLGGKCWHDGTSLWASEHWIPLLELSGEPAVWSALEVEYRRRFAGRTEQGVGNAGRGPVESTEAPATSLS